MNHPNQASKTVTLFSQPYLDRFNQCYKNIITIKNMAQIVNIAEEICDRL